MAYLEHMGYARRFAEESRHRIAMAALEAMVEAFGDFQVWGRIETHLMKDCGSLGSVRADCPPESRIEVKGSIADA